jgi:hypothetical protein
LQSLRLLEINAHHFEVARSVLLHVVGPLLVDLGILLVVSLSLLLELVVLNESSILELLVEFKDLLENLLVVFSVNFRHFAHDSFHF